jgi:cation:H+ antiporter
VPARHGRGDIALGNLFGTIAHFAAFNAGIIALVRPIHLDTTSRHLHPPVAAASVFLLVALTARRRELTRPDGTVLLTLYAGYVAAAISVSVCLPTRYFVKRTTITRSAHFIASRHGRGRSSWW